MLKADLHIHSCEDPIDRNTIRYNARQLVDQAKKLNFKVIALTHHERVFDSRELQEYAKTQGILLITGAEACIEGAHVLIYNINNAELAKLKTFHDLKELRARKGKQIMVIAPHAFFPGGISLQNKLLANIELFDALEFSHFYTGFLNFNKKAQKVALEYQKPLIGNSDAHLLWQLGKTYTLIDCEPTVEAVFSAIRQNKIKLMTRPLKLSQFCAVMFYTLYTIILHYVLNSGKKEDHRAIRLLKNL